LEFDFIIAGGSMAQEDSTRQQELDQKRQYWKTHIASWQASLSPVMQKCTKNGNEECTTLRGVPW
jgi:hypothetical protein